MSLLIAPALQTGNVKPEQDGWQRLGWTDWSWVTIRFVWSVLLRSSDGVPLNHESKTLFFVFQSVSRANMNAPPWHTHPSLPRGSNERKESNWAEWQSRQSYSRSPQQLDSRTKWLVWKTRCEQLFHLSELAREWTDRSSHCVRRTKLSLTVRYLRAPGVWPHSQVS
jgi:hypothetical protein